jgi:hypothetical protein
MLNQALKTIDLQLFAEPGEESSLFEEPTADENIPGTTQAETENAAVTKADSPSLPKENGQTIRIKYNGSEMELSRDEAVTLAQKGMNYDKLTERLRSFENSEELKVLDAYARQNGMTRKQYVKQLQTRQAESLVESEMREIKTRYPELPDAAAKELAEIKAAEKRREFEENEKQEAERLKQEQLRPWQEFSKAYPEIRDVQTSLRECLTTSPQARNQSALCENTNWQKRKKRSKTLSSSSRSMRKTA